MDAACSWPPPSSSSCTARSHGRYLYAIGYNLEAARFSGVRIHSLRIFTFALSGFLAGLAGILEATTIHSVAPSSAGMAYELYGITAAVLGGCALRGARDRSWGSSWARRSSRCSSG